MSASPDNERRSTITSVTECGRWQGRPLEIDERAAGTVDGRGWRRDLARGASTIPCVIATVTGMSLSLMMSPAGEPQDLGVLVCNVRCAVNIAISLNID